MTEYFYTNSLDAFYMEQKWGVKYKGQIGGSPINVTPKSGVIRIGAHLRLLDKCPVLMAFVPETDEPNTEWVVHEDSVHLFEPQLADMNKDGDIYSRESCGWDYYSPIIQRNNETFIMPEVRSR